MTGVILGQDVVPVLLLTVHGHVRPIGGCGCRVWGPVSPRLAKGLHVSLGRGGSRLRGLGAFDDVIGARVRQKNAARGAYLA
jgi:hypothetical protein